MSDPDCRFEVPGVPRGQERNRHRIATGKGGRQFVANYLPKQTRAEQAAVRLFAQQAMEGRPPLEGPIELRMTAYMPIPASWSQKKQAMALAGIILPTGRPDFDNLAKSIADGIRQIAIKDDAQVVSAHLWKRYSDRPRAVVELRCMGQQPLALPSS